MSRKLKVSNDVCNYLPFLFFAHLVPLIRGSATAASVNQSSVHVLVLRLPGRSKSRPIPATTCSFVLLRLPLLLLPHQLIPKAFCWLGFSGFAVGLCDVLREATGEHYQTVTLIVNTKR